MFNNIGSKIMKLAKILCWIGISLSVITGLVIIAGGYYQYRGGVSVVVGVVIGIITIILGSLFSWIGSFFTYGFGRLIENTDNIRNNLQPKD